MSEVQKKEEWRLNKGVPLALIVTIFVQTIAVVWFASELRFDVNANKEDIIQIGAEVDVLERILGKQAVTLGRIAENLEEIRRSLQRIEGTSGSLR